MSNNADVRIVTSTLNEKIFYGEKSTYDDNVPTIADLFESAAKWLREMPYEDEDFIEGLHWEEGVDYMTLSIYYTEEHSA